MEYEKIVERINDERLNSVVNVYIVIPERLVRELIELGKETRLSIEMMVLKAIRRYIDSEKSSDEHVWIDGVKYPIPDRLRIP